jgi:hypothetical protein
MPVRRFAWLSALLPLLAVAPFFRASGPEPERSADERILKEAGVATDGPALLDYLRRQTPDPTDHARLTRAVRLLGDDSFAVREKATRELIRAGRPALPLLRRAIDDPDREIAFRARRCLATVQNAASPKVTAAAARMLAQRRPAGTAEALLGYLPFADDDALEQTLLAGLTAAGLRDGKPDPALTAALTDKVAARRAAAAHVLGRAADAEVRRPVAHLLKDTDARVRFEAAVALACSGERSAVPVLIALLDDGPMAQAWEAESLLVRLAGDDAPEAALRRGDDEERARCREGWNQWWKAEGARADLARLKQQLPALGVTVVCEFDGACGGRVLQLGPDGRVRAQLTRLEGPNDVHLLPGGRTLVAERNGNRVTERDGNGKVCWECKVSGSPIACQRLPSGNTLIATFNRLLEVTPAGKEVHSHTHRSGFRHAVRWRNHHVVYVASNGEVVELDKDWKEVRVVTPADGAGAGYWASVEPLPGGRFLIALGGKNKVLEIDGSGKVLWECTVPSAVFATRLRNGNTLVSSFEGRCLIEVDRSGKQVSRQELQGRPFAVRRY